MTTTSQQLIVSRSFKAPRELVFRAWTSAEHLKLWWGAEGFTIPSCSIDLRPGGLFRYHMRSPQGRDYRCKCVYREVVAPERLSFTNAFVDAADNPAPHPELPAWPRETLLTIAFAEQRGGTNVTLSQIVTQGTAAERDAFAYALGGARQFWTQTLERLEADLKQQHD